MPIPMSVIPVTPQTQTSEIEKAVESVLVAEKVISANSTAVEILNSCGSSLEQAIVQLANLSANARDAVKLNAVKDILDIHGVKFRQDVVNDSKPTIVFNIQAENVQANLNTMFDPSRS